MHGQMLAAQDAVADKRSHYGKDKPWTPGSQASEFIRQQQVIVLDSGPPQGSGNWEAEEERKHLKAWVVLSSTHILIYNCPPTCPSKKDLLSVESDNTGCKYPNNGVPSWWMDISTVEVGTMTEFVDTLSLPPSSETEHAECTGRKWPWVPLMKYCMKLTGLAGESQEKVSTEFCDQDQGILITWRNDIEQTFLNAHGIKGHMIDQKVRDAVDKIEIESREEIDKFYISELPLDAMAPLLCKGVAAGQRKSQVVNDLTRSPNKKSDIAHLDARMRFTEGQAVPFFPGKNSRSKAKFFFSPDGSMIIKMIREEEYTTLWGMVNDCSYSKRLTEVGEGKSSLLNPIILAFIDANQYWVVMRSEYVPKVIADQLPPKGSKWRRDFHNDIKPGNMVSDRKEFARMVMNERLLTGLQMTPALDDILTRLETDVDYLANKKLMDYSLLVFGSFVELDHDDAGSRDFFSPSVGVMPGAFNTVQKVAAGKVDADGFPLGTLSMGGLQHSSLTKPSPKQRLQKAVTLASQCGMECSERPRKLVDVTGRLNKDEGGDYHYRWSGKSYRCCCIELKPGDSALVRSPCALVQLAGGSGKCGSLLGSRFHSYYRPSVGGKCLIEWDQWQEIAGLSFLSGRSIHQHAGWALPQEVLTLQQMKIASRVESCAIVCVTVADYLLQSTTMKQVENIVLIPVYSGRKWSDYDTRTVRLLRCLIGGQPPAEPQDEDKKRPGLLKLFLQETHDPLQPNEMLWKYCKEDFPEVRVLDDMKVVEELVQMQL